MNGRLQASLDLLAVQYRVYSLYCIVYYFEVTAAPSDAFEVSHVVVYKVFTKTQLILGTPRRAKGVGLALDFLYLPYYTCT